MALKRSLAHKSVDAPARGKVLRARLVERRRCLGAARLGEAAARAKGAAGDRPGRIGRVAGNRIERSVARSVGIEMAYFHVCDIWLVDVPDEGNLVNYSEGLSAGIPV